MGCPGQMSRGQASGRPGPSGLGVSKTPACTEAARPEAAPADKSPKRHALPVLAVGSSGQEVRVCPTAFHSQQNRGINELRAAAGVCEHAGKSGQHSRAGAPGSLVCWQALP